MAKHKLSGAPLLLTSPAWQDYALLDSGAGRKLEKFGDYIFDRPEPSALWAPASPHLWNSCSAKFSSTKEDEEAAGQWQFSADVPDKWPLTFNGTQFYARRTNFRHVGLFPEQAASWVWLQQQLTAHAHSAQPKLRVLNLFGYTGVMSLLCAAAGAEVTHVDASKKSVQWGQESAVLNNISTIRWLVDDALGFAEREVRRGKQYDGIILDPPKYGRGPDGEVWEFWQGLMPLLTTCAALLSPTAKFMLLTAYNARLASRSLAEALASTIPHVGQIDYGDYALPDTAERQLGLALFARWSAA